MKSVLLVLALCMTLSACTGPFNATKRLHNWNRSFDGYDGWAEEGVFLLCCILPYPLTVLGDSLIFNSVEFWGGTNPVAPAGMAMASGEMDKVASTFGVQPEVHTVAMGPVALR
ncbi:MAG: DUF3332 family protein [Planctomycetota bacterium]